MTHLSDRKSARKIYYPPEQAEQFVADWTGNHFRQEKAPVRTYDNAVIVPLRRVKHEYGSDELETGILDSTGKYVPESGMKDKLAGMLLGPLPDSMDFLDETVIYCGRLILHYGHFLLQSTARLYYFLQNRTFPGRLLFVCERSWNDLPVYVKDFFALLGIPPGRILLVSTWTRVRKLIHPPLSSRYFKDYTDDFLLPFQEAARSVPPGRYKKVFFSRRKWTGMAKCFGEEELEKLFCLNGFDVVMPEQLSLKQQIAVIKGAEVLAGINGTSFHNILFGGPGKQLIFLNRNEEYDSQYILNETVRADWYVVKVHANPFPVNHPHGPFIVGLTPELREFCADHGLKTVGITFKPDKYLKSFLDYYCMIYSQISPMQELITRGKDRVDAADLIRIISLIRNSRTDLWLYRLLFRLTTGFRKQYYDLKCQALKNMYKDESAWKY